MPVDLLTTEVLQEPSDAESKSLLRRLQKPFTEQWRTVRNSEAESLWYAQQWQAALWGSAWVWRNVLGHHDTCLITVGQGLPREAQLAAMRLGMGCDHQVCKAWYRLYRRTRALTKLLRPEYMLAMDASRHTRQGDLLDALRTRFGPLDASETSNDDTPLETLPGASLGHSRAGDVDG